jgi:hypothetical protein
MNMGWRWSVLTKCPIYTAAIIGLNFSVDSSLFSPTIYRRKEGENKEETGRKAGVNMGWF